MQDVRYGLRVLARGRAVTAIAVFTMALAIGATIALFGIFDAILLRPLPYPSPERLLMLWRKAPPAFDVGYADVPWNRADFLEFQRSSRAFDALGAFKADTFNLTGSGRPESLTGLRATAGFFPSLGVAPALGRTFTAEEDRPGAPPVVVLSDGLWRARFGGDPALVGRTVDLDGVARQVVGIMPPQFAFPRAEEMPAGFNFPKQMQVWVPAALDPGPAVPAETSDYAVVGRLRAGTPLARAQQELDAHEHHMETLRPAGKGWFHTTATPLAQQIAARASRPLVLLLGAVTMVLLIACANVAGLLLARSIGRQREFSIRAALGATRGRLIRQMLTESTLLAAVGGLAGILVGRSALDAAVAFAPAAIPRLHEAALDARVIVFAVAISAASGCLFGLAPALGAGRAALASALQRASTRTLGSGNRLRRWLLAGEVALAVVLVVATGLLARTFYYTLQVDPGFRPQHALTFELSLPALKYPDAASAARLYAAIRGRLAALPGVDAVGIVETVPMNGATEATGVRFPGRPADRGQNRGFANYTVTSPGYLRAAGTPLLRGRDFLESDDATSAPVAIINSTMARKYWPGRDPIGQQVGPASSKYPVATVIGVATDVKHLSLRDAPQPEMYVLYTQKVYPSLLVMDVIIRTGLDPESLIGPARAAVEAVDPDLPVGRAETLAAVVDDSVKAQRFLMLLIAGFGGTALVLVAVGLYGLVSYIVGQRTQEIGLRIALGADHREVFTLMIAEGVRPAAIGLLAGLAASAAVSRAMAGFLYGVTPLDPLTFAIAAPLLLAIAAAAAAVPARRATRIDPLSALRAE